MEKERCRSHIRRWGRCAWNEREWMKKRGEKDEEDQTGQRNLEHKKRKQQGQATRAREEAKRRIVSADETNPSICGVILTCSSCEARSASASCSRCRPRAAPGWRSDLGPV